MAALDDGSLLIQYGNLFIGSNSGDAVNISTLRNVMFTAQAKRSTVNSDNRGTIVNKARLQGKVNAEMLKVGNMSVLEAAFKGLGHQDRHRRLLDAPITGEVTASGSWAYGQGRSSSSPISNPTRRSRRPSA